ncbi:MAG: TetR-like C-terminal domain-containing protein [Proteobacteria bacterium]|nr:TetR-like C-terminal domain-containing protein [Pseudomonadota bacterium]
MGRRSDHSRDEIRRMALAAAQRRLESGGLPALTARSVADDIGYAVGTLYNLFDNLDMLVVHVNGATLDMLHDELAPTVTGKSPDSDLAAMLAAYLRFLTEKGHLWGALFEHRRPGDSAPLPDWYLAKVARVLGVLESALRPLFPDDDAAGCAQAARVLWASLHGICSLGETGKLPIISAQSVADMANSLVENYVAGLRVRQANPRAAGE